MIFPWVQRLRRQPDRYVRLAPEELAALAEAIGAAGGLFNKVKEIGESDEFADLVAAAESTGHSYTGPTMTAEFVRLGEALRRLDEFVPILRRHLNG